MDASPSTISSQPVPVDTSLEDTTKLQNLNTLGAILLGIFTIVSFVGNIFLLSTVASSYQLRQSVFNYFLVNVSLVNLIDTAVNLVLSMLYVSTGQWQLGRAACILNSFFQQLVLIETMISVVLLSVDRAIALQSIHRYEDRLTPLRSILVLSAVWSVGAVVSLPILAGSMWSEPNRYRYFCCNYANNPAGYPISIVIICFAIPLFVAFLSLAAIFWRAHEERLRRRAMLPERLADYTDFIVDNRRVQKHMELSKYSVISFLVYFLLQGPYVVLNFFGQIRNSVELTREYGGRNALIAGDAETAITWLKTLFPVCFPFLTFCLCRDIWRKFKDLICCRRTNVIAANAFSSSLEAADVAALAAGYVGAGAGGFSVGYGQHGHGHGGGGKEMANVVTIVPTAAGIHQIRPGNDRCEYADVPQMAAASMGRRRSRDSQHQQRRLHPASTTSGGRTSDYDSEDSDTLSAAALEQQENSNIQNRKTGAPMLEQRAAAARAHPKESIPVDQCVNQLEISDSNAPTTSTRQANAVGQAILSPSAVDTRHHQKDDFDQEIDKSDDLQISIGKSSRQSIDTEWPTVFRPKSASGDPSSVHHLSASALKHQQVNPGVVPSPERSAPSFRRPKANAAPIQESQEEIRRSSLDEKMKLILEDASSEKTNSDKVSPRVEEPLRSSTSTDSILANSAVIRHNHLPPLNVDSASNTSACPPRKASSDKTTTGGAIISVSDKHESNRPASGDLPNSQQAIAAWDNLSTTKTPAIRMNSQGSAVTKDSRVVSGAESCSTNPAAVNARPLPNLPHSS